MTTEKLGKADADTDFGRDLIAAMKEAVAHKRGKIALPTRVVEAISAAQVKKIRKTVARNTKEFEAKFGVPARTIEGWEQGRAVDVTACVLLRVIEKNPRAVERALAAG